MSWAEEFVVYDGVKKDKWIKRMNMLDRQIWLDASGIEHPFVQMDNEYILNCMSWALNEIHYAQMDYDYYDDYSDDANYKNERIEQYIKDLNYIYEVFYSYYNERINNSMMCWE